MISITSRIKKSELISKHNNFFKTTVKAVVDVRKKVIVLDAELHADLESLLLEKGSKQQDLWGINLYPSKKKDDFIEYLSFINIRPHQDNPAMEVQDPKIKKMIQEIVFSLIDYDA
jgi:hypothetical protein